MCSKVKKNSLVYLVCGSEYFQKEEEEIYFTIPAARGDNNSLVILCLDWEVDFNKVTGISIFEQKFQDLLLEGKVQINFSNDEYC